MQRLTALCLFFLVFGLVSCGSGDDDALEPVAVAEMLDRGAGDAVVEGFVVWLPDRVRLCEVLMESFPPQCGERSVVVGNPELLTVDRESEGDVQWTPGWVTLAGRYDGDEFILDPG